MSGVEGLQALDQAVRQRLFTDLSDRGRCCAITLLDCGAGISRSVLSFAAAAGAALVVTTPAPAALTDAYALIKGLHRLGVQLQLIVNRARPGTGQAAAARLQGVCARFLNLDLPVLGVIPEDEQVERAVVNGQLFMQAYPDCPAARALVKMATDISGQAVPQGSLWGRLGALLER
jgi:flagellar biosynthesis protein FlhG